MLRPATISFCRLASCSGVSGNTRRTAASRSGKASRMLRSALIGVISDTFCDRITPMRSRAMSDSRIRESPTALPATHSAIFVASVMFLKS